MSGNDDIGEHYHPDNKVDDNKNELDLVPTKPTEELLENRDQIKLTLLANQAQDTLLSGDSHQQNSKSNSSMVTLLREQLVQSLGVVALFGILVVLALPLGIEQSSPPLQLSDQQNLSVEFNRRFNALECMISDLKDSINDLELNNSQQAALIIAQEQALLDQANQIEESHQQIETLTNTIATLMQRVSQDEMRVNSSISELSTLLETAQVSIGTNANQISSLDTVVSDQANQISNNRQLTESVNQIVMQLELRLTQQETNTNTSISDTLSQLLTAQTDISTNTDAICLLNSTLSEFQTNGSSIRSNREQILSLEQTLNQLTGTVAIQDQRVNLTVSDITNKVTNAQSTLDSTIQLLSMLNLTVTGDQAIQIGETFNQTGMLSQTVSMLNEKVMQQEQIVNTSFNNVALMIEMTRATISSNLDQIVSLNTTVRVEQASLIRDNHELIQNVSSTVSILDERMTQQDITLAQSITDLSTRFEAAQRSIFSNTHRINSLNDTLGDGQRILGSSINNILLDIEQKESQLNSSLQSLDSSILNLGTQAYRNITTLSESTQTGLQELNDQAQKITIQLSTSTRDVTSRLDLVEAEQSSQRTTLNHHEAQITSLRSDVTNLGNSGNGLTSNIAILLIAILLCVFSW